ncbi:hypothetical protein MK079_00950 [Candidatus Gracilibacteria bacterium]|nr:hypothetical protein [Candidatus Gracilibacteria bacterium]
MSFQNESVVQTKTCLQCGVSFDITDKDLEFYEKVSPTFGGKKYRIPTPTLCPECRQQRRLSFRNERKLYKRKCDATGKDIISIYSPDKDYTVYNQEYWWSDHWDVLEYGRDIDFSQGFFSQFHQLLQAVPKRAFIRGTGSEGSDYSNYMGQGKNCYLVFNSDKNTDCLYCSGLINSQQYVDCLYTSDSSESYDLVDCINCYACQHLVNCTDCSYCFGSSNLHRKSYYIFNKPYSKKQYFQQLENLGICNHSDIGNTLHQNLKIVNSQNALGDNIYNCSDIYLSFDCYDTKNARYTYFSINGVEDCMDVDIIVNHSSYVYDSHIINKNCRNIIFCSDCWKYCENMLYCSECKTSKNCMLCTGLTDKQYCILNKQYSKQEYEKLVPKIIEKMKEDGEWGEFFPYNVSPFGYNETVANEYYPLDKGEALKQGFNWSNYEAPFPKVDKVIPAVQLPENIKDVPDDILNWAIECEMTQKPFRIIPQELEFYRKHNLPIPRRHPDQRHLDRMSLRNPRKLFERVCDHPDCTMFMQTTYAPERTEKVYCQKCYNQEIY